MVSSLTEGTEIRGFEEQDEGEEVQGIICTTDAKDKHLGISRHM